MSEECDEREVVNPSLHMYCLGRHDRAEREKRIAELEGLLSEVRRDAVGHIHPKTGELCHEDGSKLIWPIRSGLHRRIGAALHEKGDSDA